MIQVLVCAGHPLTRMGLRAVVDGCPDATVAGEAADVPNAVERVRSLRPDVVIVDEAPPEVDGIDLARRTGAEPVAPAVLLLVAGRDERIVECLRAGVRGVLRKDCDPAELRSAIEAVTTVGARFLSTRLVGAVVDRVVAPFPVTEPAPIARLTRREREVLALLADGLSNEEISARLFVSRPTVKYHVSHLLQKLDLRDRLQAAVFAHQHGITGPGA